MRPFMRGVALTFIAVATAGTLIGCNKGSATATGSDGVSASDIATVNGTPITRQDFFVTLQSYRPQQRTAAQPAGMVKLRQMIEDTIIEQLANKAGVYPTDAQINEQLNNIRMVQELNSVQPFDDQLKNQGLTEDYLKRLQIIPQLCQLNLLAKGITITDGDVKAYYDRHRNDMFTKPERAHIKRMVLASEADAQAVEAELKKGTAFEQLNATHSMDKQLAGGEFTQWLPLDNPHSADAKPLFDTIRKTPVGQTTPPVQFQGTWWIVKVVEKKPKQVFDFNTAEPMVHMSMMQQKIAADPSRYTVLEESLRNATMGADIHVTDARYNPLVDQLKNPPAAVPAAASAPVPTPSPQPAATTAPTAAKNAKGPVR